MKRILLFVLFCLLGFGITEGVMYVQHQQVQKRTAERAKTEGFSLERAPSNALQGKIVSLSGTVSWQSRIATQPAQIKEPRTIQQGEELRTGTNGSVSVQIMDGPTIILLPNSHVNFIQTLPTSIVITQDQGTVTYTASKSSLSVDGLSLLTAMTDGKMTISVDQDQKTVITTVSEGTTTEAYNDANNTSSTTMVSAGNTFLFDDAAAAGSIQ